MCRPLHWICFRSRNVRAIALVDLEQKIITPGSLCSHANGRHLIASDGRDRSWALDSQPQPDRARLHRALRRQWVALHGDLPLASGCLPRYGGARASQRRRPRWLNSRSCPSVLACTCLSVHMIRSSKSQEWHHTADRSVTSNRHGRPRYGAEQTLRPGMLGVRPLSRDILATRVGRVACSIP